ncbi:alternative ribosome rescue aminoacyl-tRNA hydrolase ArfB [Desulfovibrio oxyclinae]|jgi:ribosome-associated protein|uniref:alternative ribosome rescue aminoacyl-tRNA hydrolase ArfB n=1 Tax=Desulfovibrio oxyclinae TaxID=63560 RepID=UPI0003663EDE|nr:alternative ribosome rescue aminoacyl-tRNA hydrolase ArfB [Desulfovibrio oxyclinae]
MDIRINDRLIIPEAELRFTFSRSSGPGGQHVNTADTRVTLLFDVEGSPTLSQWQKDRLMRALASRIGKDGMLRISSDSERSQKRNREDAVRRFAQLLRDALKKRKARRPTRPTRSSVRRRIQGKKHRGAIKKARGKVGSDE